MVDATEQAIQRPKKKQASKKHYSGKKKRHTQKVEIVMSGEGEIVNVSHSVPSSEHDFKLRKRSDKLPPTPDKYVDLGYLGLDKLASNVHLPHKKPKNG